MVTECSHGEEEESAVTNSRDGFVKLNKKKYGIELPNESYCQTHCAPSPACHSYSLVHKKISMDHYHYDMNDRLAQRRKHE